MPETMYDRIKKMTLEEMTDVVFWVYLNGNRDGRNGAEDSDLGFFGGAILEQLVEDLMPNGVTDLWNLYEEGAV